MSQWLTSFGQSTLSELYQRKDYFQLKREFERKTKIVEPADRLFYQAVLDNAFNHPQTSDQAIALLRRNFQRTLNDSRRKALFNLEADNAIKTYRYQTAVTAYRSIIAHCQTDSAERADLGKQHCFVGRYC